MRILRLCALQAAVWGLYALTSCGSGSTTSNIDQAGGSAFQQWVAAQTWEPSFATGPDGMPAFPTEGGAKSPSATGGSQTVGGAAFIQKQFAEVDGDAL